MSTHYLSSLFEPRSVVLIGATEDRTKVGGLVMENLLSAGFQGNLFAVNPKYASVRGVPCFPSVGKLPQPVDLAIIVTPPKTVPGVIEECGQFGIRAAVVITANRALVMRGMRDDLGFIFGFLGRGEFCGYRSQK